VWCDEHVKRLNPYGVVGLKLDVQHCQEYAARAVAAATVAATTTDNTSASPASAPSAAATAAAETAGATAAAQYFAASRQLVTLLLADDMDTQYVNATTRRTHYLALSNHPRVLATVLDKYREQKSTMMFRGGMRGNASRNKQIARLLAELERQLRS